MKWEVETGKESSRVQEERNIIWAYAMTEGPYSILQEHQSLKNMSFPSHSSPLSSSQRAIRCAVSREAVRWEHVGERMGQLTHPHAKLQSSWAGSKLVQREALRN